MKRVGLTLPCIPTGSYWCYVIPGLYLYNAIFISTRQCRKANFIFYRFMFFVKNCCALEGQMILEEVLRHGYNTASEIIMKVYKQLEQSNR